MREGNDPDIEGRAHHLGKCVIGNHRVAVEATEQFHGFRSWFQRIPSYKMMANSLFSYSFMPTWELATSSPHEETRSQIEVDPHDVALCPTPARPSRVEVGSVTGHGAVFNAEPLFHSGYSFSLRVLYQMAWQVSGLQKGEMYV
jgi:hypothetical protein